MAISSLMLPTDSFNLTNCKTEVQPITNVFSPSGHTSEPELKAADILSTDMCAFEDVINPSNRDLNVLKDQVYF